MRKMFLTVMVLVLGLLAGFMPPANAGGGGYECDPAVEDCSYYCDPATEECVPPCDPSWNDCDAEPICDEYGYCWWPARDPFNSWFEFANREKKALLNDAIASPSEVVLKFCRGGSQIIKGSESRKYKGKGRYAGKRIGKVTARWLYHDHGFSHETWAYASCFN